MVAISQTPKGNNGRVMDNICAAICRMIVARPDALPMDQVGSTFDLGGVGGADS
jgi:hypothetical protein